MAVSFKVKRGTRAQIDAAAAVGGLIAGEPYLITDEGRLAVGLSTTTYSSSAKDVEAIAGEGLVAVDTTAPASPVEGHEWFDENDGHTYTYLQGFWVQVSRPGPKGDQGVQGVKGDPGADGADGADAVFKFCQVRNTDTSTDINTASWTNIPFGGTVDASDADFTTGSDSITCNFTGTVSVSASISQAGSVVRSNVGVMITKNNTQVSGIGLSGYIRAVSQYVSSSSIFAVIAVSTGDVIRVQGKEYGASGTVTQLSSASQVTVERRA